MNQYLWVEKYRPQTIDDCILPESMKETFKNFIDSGQLPNFLFSGGPGVGKTTVARALCNEVGAEYLFINGSEESGIDVLRNKIKNFASSVSLTSAKKIVILDEADFLNCFSENQKLIVVEGNVSKSYTMKEMEGVDFKIAAYNFESGTIELANATVVCSGQKELFEVEMENGSIITCTSDHPFFNKMGEVTTIADKKLFSINIDEVISFVNGLPEHESIYIFDSK